MDSDPFSANATSQLSSVFKDAVSNEHSLQMTSQHERSHSEWLSATPACCRTSACVQVLLQAGLTLRSKATPAMAGAALPPTFAAKRQRSIDPQNAPVLEDVIPVWLEASPQERSEHPQLGCTLVPSYAGTPSRSRYKPAVQWYRYLLLEDAETGDMLMPLIYMKAVFEANYSRKLSSLKNRLVVIPPDVELPGLRPNAYLYWQWAFESPQNVKLLVRQELGEENTPQVCFSSLPRAEQHARRNSCARLHRQ